MSYGVRRLCRRFPPAEICSAAIPGARLNNPASQAGAELRNPASRTGGELPKGKGEAELPHSKTAMPIEPVTLEGKVVRLEPLSLAHQAGLVEAGLDEAIWRYMPQTMRTPDDMRAYIEAALEAQAAGAALPFATIDQASGCAIGSTRFFNIERAHRRLEIGWTWLGLAWQRTAANTEAKYLMLSSRLRDAGLHPRRVQDRFTE